MILDRDQLERLLEGALRDVDVPDHYGVILEGSIAEGFGNGSSDIDFLLVVPGNRDFVTIPTLAFVDGRRVEVRLVSDRKIEENARRLGRLASKAASIGRIPWDFLDRCQRLGNGFILRSPEVIHAARAHFEVDLGSVVASRFAFAARAAARNAVAMLVLGEDDVALISAGAALQAAMKSWLARHGETYVGAKWISQQLERVTADPAIKERYRGLTSSRTEVSVRERALRMLALVADVGVDGCAFDASRVSLRRRKSVTTWQIGERIHVVREGRDVFVLGSTLARAWRGLDFDVSIDATIDAMPLERPEAARAIRIFRDHGLVDFAWKGAGTIANQAPWTPPPSPVRPVATIAGAPAADDTPANVALVPLAADRFAVAGMALLWANIMCENAREDARGALEMGQWRTLEASLRKMIRKTAIARLCALGVVPLPPEEEVCTRLVDFEPATGKALAGIERGLAIDDRTTAELAFERVAASVSLHRESTLGGESFPACFDSSDAWQRTLDIGFEWVRLGAYVDASFPADETRELIASMGTKSAPAPSDESPRETGP